MRERENERGRERDSRARISLYASLSLVKLYRRANRPGRRHGTVTKRERDKWSERVREKGEREREIIETDVKSGTSW